MPQRELPSRGLGGVRPLRGVRGSPFKNSQTLCQTVTDWVSATEAPEPVRCAPTPITARVEVNTCSGLGLSCHDLPTDDELCPGGLGEGRSEWEGTAFPSTNSKELRVTLYEPSIGALGRTWKWVKVARSRITDRRLSGGT